MELKITHMMKDADKMYLLFGSVAELGNRAAALTWENSLKYAAKNLLLVKEQIEEAKSYFKEYGAWNSEEIAGWGVDDVQAMIVQETASEIRDYLTYDSFDEYQIGAEQGQTSGRIFQDENNDWYISFDN